MEIGLDRLILYTLKFYDNVLTGYIQITMSGLYQFCLQFLKILFLGAQVHRAIKRAPHFPN